MSSDRQSTSRNRLGRGRRTAGTSPWCGAAAGWLFAFAVLFSGCVAPPAAAPVGTDPAALRARIHGAYDDLQPDSIVILASFESPGDRAAFRLEPPPAGAAADLTVVSDGPSSPTAGSVLRAALPAGVDLVFEMPSDGGAGSRRDWRGLPMFQFSACAEPAGSVLETEIRSGPDASLRWSRKDTLRAGWNVVRFDLEALREDLDLAEVRSLHWRLNSGIDSETVLIDDLLLADNARDLPGQIPNSEGLIAYTRGTRLTVSAPGRFELAFDRGLLVGWTGDDERNRTLPTGMGPWPIPLNESWSAKEDAPPAYDDPELFRTWGPGVAVSQRVVELSALRVVIEGVWRYAPSASLPESELLARPGHTWRYTVYPTGEMFVRVTSQAHEVGWTAPRLGYALALDARIGLRYRESDRRDRRAVSASSGGEGPSVTWVANDPALMNDALELLSADERRQVLLIGDRPAEDALSTTHLVRFGGHCDEIAVAAQYRTPTLPRVGVGRLVTDAPGDDNNDGYNESEGCFEVAPAAGVLRFSYAPAQRPCGVLVFRVHETAGKRAWLHADGRILETTARDAEGNLLFVLPWPGGGRASVELIARP